MRLLNVNTLTFKQFFSQPEIPPYGILSHRWHTDEISHKDFRKGRGRETQGYQKIKHFCPFIRERRIFDFTPWSASCAAPRTVVDEVEGKSPVLPGNEGEALQWVWVDSICIDKNSSQELSEAINSMFRWYANAEECYVYMRDVPSHDFTPALDFWRAFDSSEWFSRGWTLQELLAPATVVFCSRDWEVFGHLQTNAGSKQYQALAPFSQALKFELNERIAQITGIQAEYLSRAQSLQSASVARRMSWAAGRKTTRIEDEAYCLLGLFGVNMPLLYGEGRMAFLRLQEEIIKRSDDLSIFAWSLPNPNQEHTGILAPEIGCFEWSRDVVRAKWRPKNPFAITNFGLELVTRTQRVELDEIDPDCSIHIIQLNCMRTRFNSKDVLPVEIALIQCQHSHPRVQRSRCNDIRGRGWEMTDLFLKRRQKVEDVKFYIKLTSQHWDECRACRGAEWLLINEIPTPTANFLAEKTSTAQAAQQEIESDGVDTPKTPAWVQRIGYDIHLNLVTR